MANLTVQVIGQKSYSRNEVSDWRIYGALQRWPKDSREIQVKCAGKDGSPLRSRSHISLADSEAPLDDAEAPFAASAETPQMGRIGPLYFRTKQCINNADPWRRGVEQKTKAQQ